MERDLNLVHDVNLQHNVNLESITGWLEVAFDIIVLTHGLLLVTVLIENIKVLLHATTSRNGD